MNKKILGLFILSCACSYSNEYVSIIDSKSQNYSISDKNEDVGNYITLPPMTSYNNEFGRVFAKSEYIFSSEHYPAWRLLDGQNNHHYESWLGEINILVDQWAAFEFNQAKKVKRFHFYKSASYPCGTAKDVFLEYSDDGNNWVRASNDYTTDITHLNVQYVNVIEKEPHVYWRMYFKNNHKDTPNCETYDSQYGDSAYFIAVGEINIEFEE